MGGTWNDPAYSFQKLVSQPPFDRDAGNGVRLAKYISAPPAEATADFAEERPRDLSVERPVPDELFRSYEGFYSYDGTELNATIESVEERDEYRKEKISFDAAYGNERMSAYLFLPRNASPPYQTVVYFPTLNAWQTRTSDQIEMVWIAFWLRGGRAVLYPIYKGAYDRFAPFPKDGTSAQRDLVSQWAKDIGRSIDYLETRHDIDRARLAYAGASYGAIFGPVMVQTAGRFKAAVWLFGGLLRRTLLPESEPLNFLPRVKIPVLMINGRNDHLCAPLESQVPMFRMLGTLAEHKRHLVMDGGHVPTRISEVFRQAADWLDTYLGPVRP